MAGRVPGDPAAGIIGKVWIPACAGTTILMTLSNIVTQQSLCEDRPVH